MKDLEASTVRWMRWGVVLMALFTLGFPAYRLYEPSARAEARDTRLASLAEQGSFLFEANCSSCHGPSGSGGLAPALNSVGFLASVTDKQISQLTAVGVPGSQMVAYSIEYFGPLTDEQIKSITVYLRSQEEDAPDFAEWRTPLAREDLTGRELFVMACASCHRLDLTGTEEAPALGAGSDAEEESDGRLARRIREGKDEMPVFGRILTDDQIQKLVDYLRQVQAGG